MADVEFHLNPDAIVEFSHGRTLSNAMERLGAAIATEAKRNAPVDTGRLRASIVAGNAEPSEYGVSVEVKAGGANEVDDVLVDYAPHVEYGTSRMAAQPFLTPAAYSVVQHLEAKLRGTS